MEPAAQSRLSVSDRAQAKIRSLSAEWGRSREAVRVYAERAQNGRLELALAFDQPREQDVEVLADGITVITDPNSWMMACDRVLDYGIDGFTFAPSALANPTLLPNS